MKHKFAVQLYSLRKELMKDFPGVLRELKKQGYKDAGISYVKGRYYYVTYNSFNNIEEAQKYMNDVNKKSPGTWVRTEN